MKAPCIFCAVLDFLVTAEAKTDHRNEIKLATQNLFCIETDLKKIAKQSVFFLRISEEIGKVSPFVFTLVPDLLFDCSRVRKNTDCFAV